MAKRKVFNRLSAYSRSVFVQLWRRREIGSPLVLPERSESDPMGSYPFFRVKKIPTIAAIRMMGAALTNSHSNP